jgi:methionyl-tRNA formyltransferase
MKILFMGTPDFAAIALSAICDAGEDVIGVITLPDRPVGRGYKLTPSAVKVCALERNIPVYQPTTLKGDEFAALLDEIAPELIIVAAYGKILPKNVLDYPKYGCINIHGSLLPEYRGAAPMQRAIIDGKAFTGITTMMMDVGLDTGDILLTERIDILPEDNFETIHDKMAECGGSLMLKTIDAIRAGTLVRIPQDSIDIEPTYAAKIEKAECLINFAQDADTIHNKIRGLSPFPLSYARMPDGKMLKFVASRVADGGKPEQIGKVVCADKSIVIACGENGSDRIEITKVLPEGKGRMDAADFLRGRKISVGDILN